MRNHTQLKIFFAAVLIALVTSTIVTVPAQVTGTEKSARTSALVSATRDAGTPPQPLQRRLPAARETVINRQVATSNPGSLSFLPAVNYDSGGRFTYYTIVVGDVNGDGNPDVIVGASHLTDTVAVLLGNGDGSFRQAVNYNSGGSGGAGDRSIAVADVNGDGMLDLLVANACGLPCEGRSSVGVLLGNGDGTFQSAVTYDLGDTAAGGVAVADLNGDGKPDLLVVNGGSLSVLLGNGDGTFQTAVTYPFTGGGYIYSFAAADVNGDGTLDILILVQNLGINSISMFLGNSDGTFQPPVSLFPDFALYSVALADVNGDGKPDLLMTDEEAEVAVALGNGDGTFRSAVPFASGGEVPRRVTVADLNGDGKADLVVANSGGSLRNNIAVLLGNGDGSFQSAISFDPGSADPWALTVADVNGDGKPDILFTSPYGSGSGSDGTVGVLLNNTTLGKAGTSTSIISNLNPSTYGQKVTWTATVTSTGSITPTGKVSFTWNGYTIGSATLNSSGVATLTKSNLNADAFPLTAVYAGDATNLGSTSAVLSQVVLETTSAATLTSSPNPSAQGQAVTFTAKISSPTVIPKGPVTFTAGKTVLGSAQLSAGKAKLTTSSLPAGTNTVTVTYQGDSNIAKSTASVSQVVQ
jgi:hypothetical protein